MSEPRRLIDQFQAGPERDLLMSGASERPSRATRERVEARMLDVAAAAVAASAVGAGGASGGAALGKTGSALGVMVLKWLGIGAVAGGVMALGGSEISSRVLERRAEPPAAAAPAAPRSDAVPPPGAGLPAPVIEPSEPPPAPEPASDARTARGEVLIGKSATLLEAESLRAVEQEKKQNPARALSLVRQHLKRFPDGATAPSARRIEQELSRR